MILSKSGRLIFFWLTRLRSGFGFKILESLCETIDLGVSGKNVLYRAILAKKAVVGVIYLRVIIL